MAIWFIDGFDHYNNDLFGQPSTIGNVSDILRKWTSQDTASVIARYIAPAYARTTPGQGARFTSSIDGILYKERPGGAATSLICGASFLFTANGIGSILMSARETATDQCSVRLSSAGKLTVNRNTTVLATSANTIALNTWYWIEFKCTIDGSAGKYQVKVDGVDWIAEATGQDTTQTENDYYTGVAIGGGGATFTNVDDFYAADGTSDFIGYHKVVTLQPSGAGANTQFTPNFGKNFANVGGAMPDGDFSFNQSVAANHIDTFAFDKIPFSAGSIKAIQHVVYAKQDAGTLRTMAPVQRSGGTNYVGTTQNLSSAYKCLLEVNELNPVDAAAFEIADIDGAEFGYKLIS